MKDVDEAPHLGQTNPPITQSPPFSVPGEDGKCARVHQSILWLAQQRKFSAWHGFALSLAAAGCVTLVLYPGWMFYDSAIQWSWAARIVDEGLPSALRDYGITSQWPIANTLLRVPFYWLTRGPGSFVWLQAAFLFYSILILGRALSVRPSWLGAMVLIALWAWPNVANMSVFGSADTLSAAILNCMAAVLASSPRGEKSPPGDGLAAGKLTSLWAALALGATSGLLRANSIVTAAWFGALVSLRLFRGSRHRWLAAAGVVTALVVFPVGVDRMLRRSAAPFSTGTLGPALRIWMQDSSYQSRAAEAVLPMFVKQRASSIDPSCYDLGMWCNQARNSIDWGALYGAPELAGPLYRAYILSFFESPIQWLVANSAALSAWTGVRGPLSNLELGRYDAPVPFPSAKMSPDAAHTKALEMEGWGIAVGFSRPLPLLLVSCLVLALCFWRLREIRERLGIYVSVIVLMIVHAIPVVLFAPTPEERYQYPVILPSIVLSLVLMTDGLSIWLENWARKRARSSATVAAA